MYLKHLLPHFYRAPEDDRGDNWTPTEDEPTTAKTVVPADAAGKTAAELLAELEPKTGDEVTEQTDEEKAAAVVAAAEAEKVKIKDSRIPAARHKEILDREREKREALETELAKYKQGTQVANLNEELTAAETQLMALEKQYTKLLTDGEPEKAAEKMSEIRRLERGMNAKTAELRETAAVARAVEQTRYETTVARLEGLFPALNVDHEDFDKAKAGEVMELTAAFQTQGYTPSNALQKAVKLIMPPETKAQETALKTEARVDPKAVEAARKAAAVAKTADAVSKTPANVAKVGKEHDAAGGGAITAKDAMKMPYADFIKLSENELAVMRGDML